MSTVYEYIVKLNAKMDGILVANKALQKTDDLCNQAQRSAVGLGGKLKTAFSSIPGAEFLMNPIVLATAGIGAITKLGIENEKTKVSFEVLLQSQDKAAKMLAKINQYANTTPYEKMGLQDAAKMMLGFGIAQDAIMPNLKMIGDISMGDANKMNSLTLAFSQMTSAGKLQGQDLLQMINAGFNPLNEISKMTGRSMGDLRKDMEKGQISAEMITGAFKHATSAGGMFNGMTDRMGQTVGGKLSTLIDSGKEKLLMLFNVISPILIPAIGAALAVFEALTVPISWLVTLVGGFFNALNEGNPIVWAIVGAVTAYTIISSTAAIGNLAVAAATSVWTGAQWLLNAALTANPIGLIVAGIAILVGAIIYAYQKFGWFRGGVLAAWETMKGFGNVIMNFVVDGVVSLITGLGGVADALVKLFSGDFQGAVASGKKAVSDLLLLGATDKAISGAKEVGTKIGAAYQQGVSEVDAKKKAAGLKNSENAGIAAAVIPGATPAGAGDGTKAIKAGTDKVASGGTRNTAITINLGKMVESIVFQGGVKENENDLISQVEEALMRVLYSAQSAS